MQIIGPHDSGISDAIKTNLEPQSWGFEANEDSKLCEDRTEDMKTAYFESLSTRSLSR